jgi:hypothetical protein
MREGPKTFQHKTTKSKKSSESILLDEHAIGALLGNPSDTVRSLAFSVLITSFSSTRPFSPAVLELLKSYIGLFHSDTDAKFRNELLSNTKHMIERLRGASALLIRELEQSSFILSRSGQPSLASKVDAQTVHDTIESLVAKHKEFIEWYVEFLLSELIPTASYQRHITALRAIQILLNSQLQCEVSWLRSPTAPSNTTMWPFNMQFFNSRSIRLLLDLLMDPFEDVRTIAMDILRFSPPSWFANVSPQYLGALDESVTSAENMEGNVKVESSGGGPLLKVLVDKHEFVLLNNFIIRANIASMRSGRADYADGVARAYKILYYLQPSLDDAMKMMERLVIDLESKVVVAEQNLAQAVLDAPVHGNFAALR